MAIDKERKAVILHSFFAIPFFHEMLDNDFVISLAI